MTECGMVWILERTKEGRTVIGELAKAGQWLERWRRPGRWLESWQKAEGWAVIGEAKQGTFEINWTNFVHFVLIFSLERYSDGQESRTCTTELDWLRRKPEQILTSLSWVQPYHLKRDIEKIGPACTILCISLVLGTTQVVRIHGLVPQN